MKTVARNFFFIYTICLSSVLFAQDKTVLPATSLKPYGRSVTDNQKNLALISSAVHFGFSFNGKECAVYAFVNDAAGHNYMQYELDGIYQKRIKITGRLFAIYLMLNGVERFFIEKIRVNTKYNFFGFHPTQAEIISFLLVVSGIIMLLLLKKRQTKVSDTSTETVSTS